MASESTLPLRLHVQHFKRAGGSISIKPLSEEEAAALIAGEAQASSEEVQFDMKSLTICLDRGCLIVARADGAGGLRQLIRMPVAMSDISHSRAGALGVEIVRLRVACGEPAESSPGGAPRSSLVWLFIAEDHDAARSTLDALGMSGGIRSDIETVYALAETTMGSGTSADVYRARSFDGRPDVAAKCFKDRRAEDEQPGAGAAGAIDIPQDVRKEVGLLALAQGHPNIVRLYGLFRINGGPSGPTTEGERKASGGAVTWCLTMELCAGDLYDRVKERRYSEAAARPVLKNILEGLSHVHGVGVLHRDMKVENVMMRQDGTAVIADFGLSCAYDENDELAKACGSPGYVAPEVIMKFGAVEQSDVWSVGVVLYFMFSGKLPFRGPDVMTTLRRSARAELNFDQHKAFGRVSDLGKEYLQWLLSRSPADRPCADEAVEHAWMNREHHPRAMVSADRPLASEEDPNARDDDQNSEAAHSIATSGSSIVSRARALSAMSRSFRSGSRVLPAAPGTSRSRQVSVSSARSRQSSVASAASGEEQVPTPTPPQQPLPEAQSRQGWRYTQAAAAGAVAGERSRPRAPSADQDN